MQKKAFSRVAATGIISAFAITMMAACIKELPLPTRERDALADAVTQATSGNMDIMTIEAESVARTPAYLRIALKAYPDKLPRSKSAIRIHMRSNAMNVIRHVAQHSTIPNLTAIQVEYYVNVFPTPRQQGKGPERVRKFYSTSIQTKKLNARDLSTITDEEMAALVTHTFDEIRKLDVPN